MLKIKFCSLIPQYVTMLQISYCNIRGIRGIIAVLCRSRAGGLQVKLSDNAALAVRLKSVVG